MRLKIPAETVQLLRAALERGGRREIGGQIYGEQLAPSDFQVVELTFQRRQGTFARFMVDLVQATRDAMRFFDRTSHKYMQFNYIGEWHSHPSFALSPSRTDIATMRSLVSDDVFKGSFAVLMIVKSEPGDELGCRAWLFERNGTFLSIELEIQE
ncbi:MAG: Mov34/MPN/PAD-1 family protein [Candidatus Sumerlaeaceae bacterium]